MQIKIGRFEAYVPDKDPFEIILQILSLAFKSGDYFNSPPNKLHQFFYKMKERYPDQLEDVFFNHDQDFPFSEEISDAFTRLQESGYVSRPNPSFYHYHVVEDLSDKRPETSQQYLQIMAQRFKEDFRLDQ